MKENELIHSKTTETTLSQTERHKTPPPDRTKMDNMQLSQGKECPPQATPAVPKPW
jgi:hypothetical protein